MGGVDLVDADDGDGFFASSAFDPYRRAEKYLIGVAPGGVHDLRALEPLDEEAHAAVDLAQSFLSIEVVGVLGAIAERRRPCHGLHHFRPLALDEAAQL